MLQLYQIDLLCYNLFFQYIVWSIIFCTVLIRGITYKKNYRAKIQPRNPIFYLATINISGCLVVYNYIVPALYLIQDYQVV
jgi:membrane protein insertase Oxa1/YidC/SpoIIIJ